MLYIKFMSTLRWLPQNTVDKVNIGSANSLVPSGTEPLPEPMLSQIYVTIWYHQATMS